VRLREVLMVAVLLSGRGRGRKCEGRLT